MGLGNWEGAPWRDAGVRMTGILDCGDKRSATPLWARPRRTRLALRRVQSAVAAGALPCSGRAFSERRTGLENPEGILAQSPGLRGTSYPGVHRAGRLPTPTGLRRYSPCLFHSHNPVGVGDACLARTQGSSCLATLGWKPQSRWDWQGVSGAGIARAVQDAGARFWAADGLLGWRG